jgi:hypothetical protein
LHKENEPAVKRRKKVQPGHLVRLCRTARSLCPVFKGAARKERATSESREVYTPLRGTPPSRLSDLCGVYAPFLGVLRGSVKRLSNMKFIQDFSFGNILIFHLMQSMPAALKGSPAKEKPGRFTPGSLISTYFFYLFHILSKSGRNLL